MSEEAMFSFIKSKNMVNDYEEFIQDKLSIPRKMRLELFITYMKLDYEYEQFFQRMYNGGYE